MEAYALYLYRLHELFIANFGSDRKVAKMEFSQTFGHSIKTIEADCSKTIGDRKIPRDRLEDYAEFLNVELEDLKPKKQAA
jgi:hypothetical protein